jgi:hypothetical protein
LDVFLTARGAEAAIEAAHQTSGQRLDAELGEMADSPFTDGMLWRGLDSKDFSNAASEAIGIGAKPLGNRPEKKAREFIARLLF